MSRKASIAVIAVFLTFITVLFALNLILPDRDFSQQENRYLQQAPEFTLKALFSGKFTSDFEKYTTDQFVMRDTWTSLKAGCELLLSKSENNGVFLCRGDVLIEPFAAPSESDADAKTEYVNKLLGNVDVPVYFGLIPEKSELWGDMLPANAPNDSQRELIERAYSLSGAENIDLVSPLSAHSGEYIYYRTDHHWTSRGAHYGADAILEAMGLPSPSHDEIKVVSEEFYGTTYSSSGFSWIGPDSIETWVDAPAGLQITNYPDGSPAEGVLYDDSFLDKKDKYSFFMGGNSPLQRIITGNDGPSVLIVRDSYADSLAPHLLGSFSEIHLLDLRYYRASLSDYIAANSIDNVLVLYSVTNFSTDVNLFLLGK